LTHDLRIRPIRPDDEPRLVALFHRLSPRSVYQRFFAARTSLPAAWYHAFANVDHARRLALVAERDTESGVEIVGVARYEPSDAPDTAEIAVVVDDAWQGHGVGRDLITRLLDEADARGIRRFRADVLGENRAMLTLLAHTAHIESQALQNGVIEIEFTRRRPAA
jgi:RimJ/RimL family protein N-acetyltransferase